MKRGREGGMERGRKSGGKEEKEEGGERGSKQASKGAHDRLIRMLGVYCTRYCTNNTVMPSLRKVL